MFDQEPSARDRCKYRAEMERRDAYYCASQPIIKQMAELRSMYTSISMTFSPTGEMISERITWDPKALALYQQYEKALELLHQTIWRNNPCPTNPNT